MNGLRSRSVVAVVMMLAGLLAAGGALAQDTTREAARTALPENTALANDWQFALRPYFFLSGLSGSITVTPLTFPVNSGFTDLLDNLKLGGFISFTAEKGQWGAVPTSSTSISTGRARGRPTTRWT